MEGRLLNPLNYETVYFTPPELSKTGQINSQAVLNGGIYYSNRWFATVTAGLLQYQRFCLFFFYFG
jgi:hypothetical protein